MQDQSTECHCVHKSVCRPGFVFVLFFAVTFLRRQITNRSQYLNVILHWPRQLYIRSQTSTVSSNFVVSGLPYILNGGAGVSLSGGRSEPGESASCWGQPGQKWAGV